MCSDGEDFLCCECNNKNRLLSLVGFLVFFGLLLLVILLPMSLQRVGFDEAAIVYDTTTRELSTKVLREGLHDVGPSGQLLVVKTTQRNIFLDNYIMLSRDGIEMIIDIDVFYVVQFDEASLVRIFGRYGDQSGHDRYLTRIVKTVTLEVAAQFLAREFVESRQAVQNRMLVEMRSRFALFDTDATVETLNLRNIDFSSIITASLNETTIAAADVARAASERSAAVQQANIRLAVARGNAEIVMINATRDGRVLVQAARQQVVGLRSLWSNRIATFVNISNAFARGGDFFVDTYVKNLVLQSAASNVEKTLIV